MLGVVIMGCSSACGLCWSRHSTNRARSRCAKTKNAAMAMPALSIAKFPTLARGVVATALAAVVHVCACA